MSVAGAKIGDPLLGGMLAGDGHRVVVFGGRASLSVGGVPGGVISETIDGQTWTQIDHHGLPPIHLGPLAVGIRNVIGFSQPGDGSNNSTEIQPWLAVTTSH